MSDSLASRGYQIEFLSHAQAILSVDFPDALSELEAAHAETTIPIEEIIAAGGGEAKGQASIMEQGFASWRRFRPVETARPALAGRQDFKRIGQPPQRGLPKIAARRGAMTALNFHHLDGRDRLPR